jgi:hypothetical protein
MPVLKFGSSAVCRRIIPNERIIYADQERAEWPFVADSVEKVG